MLDDYEPVLVHYAGQYRLGLRYDGTEACFDAIALEAFECIEETLTYDRIGEVLFVWRQDEPDSKAVAVLQGTTVDEGDWVVLDKKNHSYVVASPSECGPVAVTDAELRKLLK